MSRYYCPYCSSKYQFHKQRFDGVMICGQCGDPLEKVPLIRFTQIFAFIAVIGFVIPLVLMLLALVKDLNTEEKSIYIEAITILPTLNIGEA